MEHFYFQNNELITGGRVISFEHDIREVMTVHDVLVVLLEEKPLEDRIRNNVYGVKNGSIIWQVQDVREILPSNSVTYSYSFMTKDDDKIIIADDMGLYFRVDAMTGKLTFLQWQR